MSVSIVNLRISTEVYSANLYSALKFVEGVVVKICRGCSSFVVVASNRRDSEYVEVSVLIILEICERSRLQEREV